LWLERAEEMSSRIVHVNVFEDHTVTGDNVLKRTVFVYRRDGKLSCDLCESYVPLLRRPPGG